MNDHSELIHQSARQRKGRGAGVFGKCGTLECNRKDMTRNTIDSRLRMNPVEQALVAEGAEAKWHDDRPPPSHLTPERGTQHGIAHDLFGRFRRGGETIHRGQRIEAHQGSVLARFPARHGLKRYRTQRFYIEDRHIPRLEFLHRNAAFEAREIDVTGASRRAQGMTVRVQHGGERVFPEWFRHGSEHAEPRHHRQRLDGAQHAEFESGQNDQRICELLFRQLTNKCHAVHARHIQISEDDIRALRARRGQRFRAIAAFGNIRLADVVQQAHGHRARKIVIVNDQDVHGRSELVNQSGEQAIENS